ncbi:MAG: NYN domain-containing protein [Patescibacteria group bacterium]
MRAIVFIDGNNFYNKLKELCGNEKRYRLSDFDYAAFSKRLVKDDELVEVRYYLGALKRQGDDKTEKMYADQQRFFAKLQKLNVKIILGQIIQHPDKSFHEKGVDVRIAVEMIRLARENRYDIAYLISSDTDLVPAVEEVLKFNKALHYVCFPTGQSFGITKAVGRNITLLRFEDIKTFLLLKK